MAERILHQVHRRKIDLLLHSLSQHCLNIVPRRKGSPFPILVDAEEGVGHRCSQVEEMTNAMFISNEGLRTTS
jgi:hypothetical protein